MIGSAARHGSKIELSGHLVFTQTRTSRSQGGPQRLAPAIEILLQRRIVIALSILEDRDCPQLPQVPIDSPPHAVIVLVLAAAQPEHRVLQAFQAEPASRPLALQAADELLGVVGGVALARGGDQKD